MFSKVIVINSIFVWFVFKYVIVLININSLSFAFSDDFLSLKLINSQPLAEIADY